MKDRKRPGVHPPIQLVFSSSSVYGGSGYQPPLALRFLTILPRYSPSTILIGSLRSINRACSRDSDSLSFALT
jgi:ABC-type multidrug transport system permease subunit